MMVTDAVSRRIASQILHCYPAFQPSALAVEWQIDRVGAIPIHDDDSNGEVKVD